MFLARVGLVPPFLAQHLDSLDGVLSGIVLILLGAGHVVVVRSLIVVPGDLVDVLRQVRLVPSTLTGGLAMTLTLSDSSAVLLLPPLVPDGDRRQTHSGATRGVGIRPS